MEMPTHRHGNAGSLALSRYLQRYLVGWLEAHPESTKASLARDIGTSGAHITNITLHARGVGLEVEEAIARWMGVKVDDLRERARSEFKDSPGTPTVQTEDRYRNRARALEFMVPESSPEARAMVLSVDLKSNADPPASWWVREIERAEQLVRMTHDRPDIAEARGDAATAAGDEMEEATRPKRRRG